MVVSEKINTHNISDLKNLKVKGHTTITLRNVKTGEVEVYEDDNMQTNAVSEMLMNCGWLGSDNLNQSNLIEQLLGGVLLFDDEIDEDATIVMAPDGLTMIANGAMNESNGSQEGDPTEMGSYDAQNSGWQNDGSYIMHYEWSTSQGNSDHSIACVCATGKQWGYAGEGNAQSGVSKDPTTQLNLNGSYNEYVITGYPCRLSLEDSSVYGIDLSDVSNGNITIRKYRLPIKTVNLKGTPNEPVVLSEDTISAPSHMAGNMTWIDDAGGKLMIMSSNGGTGLWGSSYTQYLFEIDPVAKTATESSFLNTSGDDLLGVCWPVWMGCDCVAFINGNTAYSPTRYTSKVYSAKRMNGAWGAMQRCANPFGVDRENWSYATSSGWNYALRAHGTRAVVHGQKVWDSGYGNDYNDLLFDYETNSCWMLNSASQNRLHDLNSNINESYDGVAIGYVRADKGSNKFGIRISRHQSCIATINNLASPIQKTPDKAMTLQYRFEFIDDDSSNS